VRRAPIVTHTGNAVWEDLHHRVMKCFPSVCDLVHKIDELATGEHSDHSVAALVQQASQHLTLESKLELQVLYNDALARSTAASMIDTQTVGAVSVVPGNDSTKAASCVNHHLCARHSTQAFLDINSDGMFVSEVGLEASTNDASVPAVVRFLMDHGAALCGCQPLRLYQYSSSIDKHICAALPFMSRTAAVREALRPAHVSPTHALPLRVFAKEIGTVAHLLKLRVRHEDERRRYVAQMEDHTHCYFCFPTLLSVVAHAWQQKYACTVMHIPSQMARVLQLNPALQSPHVFAAMVADVEHQLLLSTDSTANHPDEVIALVRSNYNNLVTALWNSTSEVVAFDVAMIKMFVQSQPAATVSR
jgi:hypothetical protein